ncbi:carbon-nitrogen hydrolase family protein [Roseovarius autotrophicus]|uniref:carbon-nitrogen hydrolase family protein n=1 Tax=Roseovarius autotrophicus TaxID=2824121 RepID=UPI0019E4EE34|nr:carbon-nitrogen hydrolase family protein [Roseovarius autotrophicus]MBE0453736.1 carbon-nitrogen hydrolase family protein [Roseovarius sp.]
MRASLLQLSSGDDPHENLATVRALMAEARAGGADFILTPEVTNCVSASRSHQNAVLAPEESDPVLAGLRDEAARLGTWLLIGSLALKTDDPDGRFANRSFLIDDTGTIRARYDKIHMFDVDVSPEETYRESDGFRPGTRAVLAETPWGQLGLSICYDIRFPHLYRRLAQAGADILTVPAAFSHVTGAAHWESLLRARAIETGCVVLAPAQTGTHAASTGKARRTHGHSLVVAPWGEVLADGGTAPGIVSVDLDLSKVAQARKRVPSLRHDREIDGP